MVSQRELEQVVEQVNGILAGLVKRIEKLEQANTTKATKSKEKS
tara:strand:+ start:104 stop:235 length:132 start_codon:yes stop_codon:yes gene_type:complete